MASTTIDNRKIAFFTPNFNGGGAERVMITYANQLHQRGYTVCYVVVNASGPIMEELHKEVPLINLKHTRVLTATVALYKTLLAHNIGILVSTLTHANIISIIAARLTFGKTTVVIREASTPSKARKFNKSILQNLAASLVFPFTNKVIAVSSGVKKDFAKVYRIDEKKIEVIYNPLAPAVRSSQPDEFNVLDPEIKKIVAIGRVTPVKNYSLLIRAIAQIQKDIKHHTFILGQTDLVPSEFQKVSQLIETEGVGSKISFLGFRSDYYRYLQYSDVFVLSSEYEGLPNALMQSLSYGVPAVSTDASSGIREILEKGKLGSIVPLGRSDLFAEAISKQLNSRSNDMLELKNRAKYFSVEKCIDTLEKYLTQ